MIKLEHPNNLLKIRAEKYIKDNNISEEEVTTISNNPVFFKMSVIRSTLHLYIPPRSGIKRIELLWGEDPGKLKVVRRTKEFVIKYTIKDWKPAWFMLAVITEEKKLFLSSPAQVSLKYLKNSFLKREKFLSSVKSLGDYLEQNDFKVIEETLKAVKENLYLLNKRQY